MARPIVVLALVLVIPLATAGGSITVGPAVFMVENGYSENCIETVSGLCLATAHGESIGETEIAAYERLTFVGAAIDRSFVNDALGYELLPDGALWVTPSDHPVEHPLFHLLIEHVGVRRVPVDGPAADFAIMFTPEGWGFDYHGPGLKPINETPDRHGFWTGYDSEGAEQGTLERDQIRPSQDLNWTSTDARVDDLERNALQEPGCAIAGPECATLVNQTARYYRSSTPDVIVGAAFIQAAAGLDPSSLRPADPLGPRDSTPVSGLHRGATPSPSAGLPIAPSAPGGFVPQDRPGPSSRDAPAPRAVPEPSAPLRPATAAPVAFVPSGITPLLAASAAVVIAVAFTLLYSRILGRPDALVRERRAEILAMLHARGPMPLREMARELGVDRTTAEYHARTLAKASMLRLVRQDRRVVLALPDQDPADHVRPPRATDHILALLRAQGGAVAREEIHRLAAEMPNRTRNHAIKSLQRQGLVECSQGAGDVIVRLLGGERGVSSRASRAGSPQL